GHCGAAYSRGRGAGGIAGALPHLLRLHRSELARAAGLGPPDRPVMSICAVIPAAGRGTRLGGAGPKILTPLTPEETIWSILHAKLSPLVDHIHLVLSPEGAAAFPDLPAVVSCSIQSEPIGMGDAIFRGHDIWSK